MPCRNRNPWKRCFPRSAEDDLPSIWIIKWKDSLPARQTLRIASRPGLERIRISPAGRHTAAGRPRRKPQVRIQKTNHRKPRKEKPQVHGAISRRPPRSPRKKERARKRRPAGKVLTRLLLQRRVQEACPRSPEIRRRAECGRKRSCPGTCRARPDFRRQAA